MGSVVLVSWLFGVVFGLGVIFLVVFVGGFIFSLCWHYLVVMGGSASLLFKVGDVGWVMTFMVVFIFIIVMMFSVVYMQFEVSVGAYSGVLVWFVGGVLVLVTGGDLYTNVLGWEVLGVSSFILISYYGSRSGWGSAYITMLVNRVGDIGFMLLIIGNILVWVMGGWSGVIVLWFMSLPLLCVVATKSAQYPASGWLPLAMAAPTPVSALVHSSTLVVAGVYMLMLFGYSVLGGSLSVWLYLGVVSLIVAGFSVVWEGDFKKIVALSTATHLSLMVLLCVLCGVGFAVAHMGFHAVFKSGLFVVIGMFMWFLCHEQDFRGVLKSGGKIFGALGVMMVISLLSLVGVAGTSGWLMKEALMNWVFECGAGLCECFFVVFALATSVSYCLKLLLVSSGMGVSSQVASEGACWPVWCVLGVLFVSLLSGAYLTSIFDGGFCSVYMGGVSASGFYWGVAVFWCLFMWLKLSLIKDMANMEMGNLLGHIVGCVSLYWGVALIFAENVFGSGGFLGVSGEVGSGGEFLYSSLCDFWACLGGVVVTLLVFMGF